MKFLYILVALISLYDMTTYASQLTKVSRPRSMDGNPHIKFLAYNETALHYYKGFYGYESSILFEEGEEFEIIAMGDPKGWQLTPVEHRLFLKPLDEGANTNATIITRIQSRGEKRVYLFKLQAAQAKNVDDEELAYEVRMVYPQLRVSKGDHDDGGKLNVLTISQSEVPSINDSGVNSNYTVAGDKEIYPVAVYDNGRFTYLQFAKNVALPAVFTVDPDGYESLINFRKTGEYIVIESVASVFSLRRGDLSACLFNEEKPYIVRNVKRRSRGIFTKSS